MLSSVHCAVAVGSNDAYTHTLIGLLLLVLALLVLALLVIVLIVLLVLGPSGQLLLLTTVPTI